MDIIKENKYKIKTNKNNEMDLYLRNYNNEKLSITLFTINQTPSKKYELKCNLEEFQKNRFFKIFININEIMKEFENKIENSIFIEDSNCIIIEIKIGLTIINEILLIIEEEEKNKDEIIVELIKNKIELEKIIKDLKDKLKDAENKIRLNEEKEKKEEEKTNNIQNNYLINKNKIFESFFSKSLISNEKVFIISNESIDIGKYLNHMQIEKYDNVYILLKEGNYFWNELYSTPENVYIQFIYEEHFNKYKHLNTFDYFDSGDKINKVKIIIDKPTILVKHAH